MIVYRNFSFSCLVLIMVPLSFCRPSVRGPEGTRLVSRGVIRLHCSRRWHEQRDVNRVVHWSSSNKLSTLVYVSKLFRRFSRPPLSTINSSLCRLVVLEERRINGGAPVCHSVVTNVVAGSKLELLLPGYTHPCTGSALPNLLLCLPSGGTTSGTVNIKGDAMPRRACRME